MDLEPKSWNPEADFYKLVANIPYYITGQVFKKFLKNSSWRVRKYIPKVLVQRIADLINSGDRDSAVTLWTKVCMNADMAPHRALKVFLFRLSYMIIGFMALYAFIQAIIR